MTAAPSPIEQAARVIRGVDLFSFNVMEEDRTLLARNIAQALSDAGMLVGGGYVVVPKEPTDKMLKSAFAAMNATPGRQWKTMKAEKLTPRRIFDAKMRPRYAAMIASAPLQSGGGDE